MKMLKYLDDHGLAENTIVIYSSDQGFWLGEHGWFDKRWMYEETVHTPLLVRWPGVTQAGQVNNDIVSNLDFAPMFLEMAGVSVPKEMQGRSLVPFLKGNDPQDWRKTFYYKYYGERFGGSVRKGYYNHGVPPHEGVADAQYKLIHFKHDEVDEWEFFDHKRDPGEMKSEYENPQYASKIDHLKSELGRLKNHYGVD